MASRRCLVVLPAALLVAALSLVVHAAPVQIPAFRFTEQDDRVLEASGLLEQRLRERALIYIDRDLTDYLTSVAAPLLPRADMPRVEWRFLVQRESMPNAAAFPNGTIYVTSGLLSVLQSEDELRAILAHEIVHVRDRHGLVFTRQIRSKAFAVNLGTAALSVGAYAVPAVPWGVTLEVMRSIIPTLVEASLYGYSRDQERDADRDGFGIFADAHTDLFAWEQGFGRLGAEPDVPREPIFWNDHPKLRDRVNAAKSWRLSRSITPPADDELETRKKRFLSAVEGVKRHNVRLDIDIGRYRAALKHARELVEWSPAPSNLLTLATAYRELGPRPVDRQLREEVQNPSDASKGRTRLMRTAAGRAAWQTHASAAETLYRKVQAIDASNGDAYLGIGELFEIDGRPQDAIQAYSKYLAISPDAPDRRAIQLRIDNLTRATSKAPR
jgi:beta-barrel assembly-enhancing protease